MRTHAPVGDQPPRERAVGRIAVRLTFRRPSKYAQHRVRISDINDEKHKEYEQLTNRFEGARL
jgi:hypothetical protein